jgi:hypothetical protein
MCAASDVCGAGWGPGAEGQWVDGVEAAQPLLLALFDCWQKDLGTTEFFQSKLR